MEFKAGHVDVNSCYISVGCNRTPSCCDWGQNNLICFGANHAIALYKPNGPSIIYATLVGHSDRVNCVKWIRKAKKEIPCIETELISSSVDKSAIIWVQKGNEFAIGSRLEGHTGSVTVLDALYVNSSRLLIATSSVDSTVKIWERADSHGECDCTQTIVFGSHLVLCLAWVVLPRLETPMLACATDDQKIHLYVEKGHQFVETKHLTGHEDWIRGLEFTVADNSDILLTSCSQDSYIRIWRLSKHQVKDVSNDDLTLSHDLITVTDEDGKLIEDYTVTLESVLQGHENWVYSVRWQKPILKDGKWHQPLRLLSASMDKTLIVWQPHEENGVWVEKVRVGEVGGGNLGFYGGMFSPDGQQILAHGFHGAFHLWRNNEISGMQIPGVTCGGHFGAVQDIVWDPEGQFLLSVSADQTTRLHAFWESEDIHENSWHEIARPQIHGYDLQCIAMVNRFSFATGADEKVVRIFRATRNFLDNFHGLCGADVKDVIESMSESHMADGASVPALGLSNKAVYMDELKADDLVVSEKKEKDQYSESYFTPQKLTVPPTEENLLQNTLWPEQQKLYGHGYEIYSVACHPNGTMIASACKAAKPEHAVVILWDVSTWRIICKLQSHSLTITQLAFSHNGQYLLSVSRDRTWSLFEQNETDTNESVPYRRIAYSDKKTAIHSRIIWSCSWSHDDKYFATVSRDKKAVVWGVSTVTQANPECLGPYKACSNILELSDSITATEFAPTMLSSDRYLLSFGLENGVIQLYSWSPEETETWLPLYTFTKSLAHHQVIKRLRFRPKKRSPNDNLQLASCSDDGSVKIFELVFRRSVADAIDKTC